MGIHTTNPRGVSAGPKTAKAALHHAGTVALGPSHPDAKGVPSQAPPQTESTPHGKAARLLRKDREILTKEKHAMWSPMCANLP